MVGMKERGPSPTRGATYAATIGSSTDRFDIERPMEWIDVCQRMPKHGERVLVAYRKDDGTSVVTTAYCDDTTGWRWGRLGTLRHQERITHWQPLPGPPSQEISDVE